MLECQKTPILKNICEQLFLHCQRLILLHHFHQKIFREEIVTSKKCNFFNLDTRETRSLYTMFIIFSSLNIMNFQSIATLFHHKDPKSSKNILSFFLGLTFIVVVTVLFSRHFGFCPPIFYWKSAIPCWYWCSSETTAWAHSEPTQTSKMELFAKPVNCWKLSTNSPKSSIVDVWLA